MNSWKREKQIEKLVRDRIVWVGSNKICANLTMNSWYWYHSLYHGSRNAWLTNKQTGQLGFIGLRRLHLYKKKKKKVHYMEPFCVRPLIVDRWALTVEHWPFTVIHWRNRWILNGLLSSSWACMEPLPALVRNCCLNGCQLSQ